MNFSARSFSVSLKVLHSCTVREQQYCIIPSQIYWHLYFARWGRFYRALAVR